MYLLLTRLDGVTYITTHANLEDLKREATWVLTDFGIEQFNWVDPSEFDNACSFDDYPDGSALAIEAFPQKIKNSELVDTRKDAVKGIALEPKQLQLFDFQKKLIEQMNKLSNSGFPLVYADYKPFEDRINTPDIYQLPKEETYVSPFSGKTV